MNSRNALKTAERFPCRTFSQSARLGRYGAALNGPGSVTHACTERYTRTACGITMRERWSGELDDDHIVSCRRCQKVLAV